MAKIKINPTIYHNSVRNNNKGPYKCGHVSHIYTLYKHFGFILV